MGLGAMVGGIQKQGSSKQNIGGLSFFLHPSIQGKGLIKTGYRLILDFFVKNKVTKFYGGTSQPAVQSLSKLMNRKIETVIYVKM